MVIKLLILFVIVLTFFSCENKINNGEQLIKEIHNTYHGKWFKNIAFEQNTSFYKYDSIYKKQIWYEVYQFPGKLAIKFDSISSRDGYLFANDTMSIINEGRVISQERKIHDLVVLSMDIYSQDALKTINQLNELGYDLSKFYIDIWNGKEAYVVGAEKGDTISKQFWIEKERLIFLRAISHKNAQNVETVFDNYIRYNKSWIEQTVVFKIDGKIVMKEEYFNIRKPNITNINSFETNNFINLKW